ncbi:PREDICTED: serrate RNA effector molecule-like isoform X1 [Lupinus angustifolius]|uniref:serrate RNA effector molecule-like isoform X1 n=1 Tax=Lupinus angustifolius TaxID=3871 RepID=UPI00092F36ED|nr:PREDICTED: serrate RNA effector molecule-like isoform X1 [Lupinus angustifolius]XP_019453465.1 PREDICTED: serrate RNA effector molecule-like isoform X1 [Lupinus angustifolius]
MYCHIFFNKLHTLSLTSLSQFLNHQLGFILLSISMAEVINFPTDSSLHKSKSQSPPPSPSSAPDHHHLPPPPPPRRRDRRDDRDFDRHPNRRPPPPDYYDHRTPPPPVHPRDRDRDFKRRRSLSPSNRGRRYSPASRRSPPPYKRSRRDSPRGGGYGHDDSRFGYDRYGGYERGVGGRGGYVDERSYGRFGRRSGGGYQNGIPDLESNRGYADMPGGGAQREGLMSYKQFIQELEDDILPAEAERRYQEYKSEYISTQKRAYFNAHKDEEWLKDKYHPTNLLTVIERRNENARQLAKDFLLDLQSGTLDLNPGLNASKSSKSGQASEPNSEEEAETGGKRRRHGRGSNKDNDFSAAPKAHPISSEPRRIQTDIQQAQALVRKLDKEKGIEDNVLCSSNHNKNGDKAHSGSVCPIVIIRGQTSVKGLEGVELLDILITYLWQIHGVDYYGMIETHEAKGLRHVRSEGIVHEETDKSSAEWEKKLDLFWQGRLNGQDPLEVMTGKEKIEAAAAEVLDPYVRKIRDEKYGWKYGCGAKGCTKLFHASEFVHKHLKLKHPELVVEQTSKVCEDLYFQNYMNDPDAPGGNPVMQQPQKDKPLRGRLGLEGRLRDDRGLEGRLRDDRGNRRDYDQNDRINGDRHDSSPSRDQQSKALEIGDHDETMYDSYGGPGVPPFASDMPPPPQVLMPLPGAGPLGPFIPAPPEVAMQMLREQGGPSSYDNPVRKMRSGPHMGGPAPIVAVPPGFRPDPRQMRSYQDLDAPDDEVTVIDYRSL